MIQLKCNENGGNMKKRIIFVFLLFVVLMVVGCKEKDPKPEGPTEEEINAAFTKAETEINNNIVVANMLFFHF